MTRDIKRAQSRTRVRRKNTFYERKIIDHFFFFSSLDDRNPYGIIIVVRRAHNASISIEKIESRRLFDCTAKHCAAVLRVIVRDCGTLSG